MSPLAIELRRLEGPDAAKRESVDRCMKAVAAGPVPMTLPWPLAAREWTGRPTGWTK
jgi:hypothetical protein